MDYKNCNDLLNLNKFSNLSIIEGTREILDEFLWIKMYNGMVPQNMVVYNRKPFISKVDSNFRVTIDYNLRTYLTNWLNIPEDKKRQKNVCPDIAILEVKFNNILPAWFLNIIERFSLIYQPFSKYCNALEVCRPELTDRHIGETYQNNYKLNNQLTYLYLQSIY
jgi:hypothetical protein